MGTTTKVIAEFRWRYRDVTWHASMSHKELVGYELRYDATTCAPNDEQKARHN